LAYFADGYPVWVMFNFTDTIIHYRDTLKHKNPYYKESNYRNFYNPLSYKKEIINESKFSRNVTLKYTFTQQDYLDAQNK